MKLHPRLIVVDAPRALEFYTRAFGAEELERHTMPDGGVVHAALRIDEVFFTVAEENRGWSNDAPPSLGGSPVILTLEVDDADAAGARMTKHGAEVVFPIADQFYGKREGRLRDPFGHLWVLSQHLEDLSFEEIQRRVAEAT
jgi:PhnB protein